MGIPARDRPAPRLLRIAGGLALVGLGVLFGRLLPAEGPDLGAGAAPGREPRARAAEAAPAPGRWRPVAAHAHPRTADAGEAPDARAEIERLEAIGYAGAHAATRDGRGVTLHDRGRAQPGLNLWNSGHEQAAWLMDMDGRVRHAWRFDIAPLLTPAQRARSGSAGAGAGAAADAAAKWRRVQVLPDGDLLAVYEGLGLLRLDRDSRLRWFHAGGEHHDVSVDPESGEIWALAREAHMVWSVDPLHATLEDFVLRLDADGRELWRLSVLDALRDSPWAPLLGHAPAWGDITHVNTIERLDGRQAARAPAFAAGNLLVSIRELDAVAVIDPRAGRVTWALAGLWDGQHQPTLLDDGHLLVFDNRGAAGWSRVIELDPLTQEVAWHYDGGPDNGFRSDECGSVQRLANGNTLVTETDSGRAFELTRGGEIVWEFVNPHRAGPDDGWIAALYEVVRLPADFGRGWLGGGDG